MPSPFHPFESAGKPKKPVHPYFVLVEELAENPAFTHRAMFGGRACYYDQRIVLVLMAKEEPWRGVLVPTEREFQASLQRDLPALTSHPVLPKWLYLPERLDSFERDVAWLVARIRALDPRIGVVPEKKKRKTAGKKKPKSAGRPRND